MYTCMYIYIIIVYHYIYIYMYVYDFVTTPLGVNYIPKFQLAESV
jgi:hypothetical protein